MKYLIIFFAITLLSCSVQNKTLIEQRKIWGYKNWKQDFKDRTLCNCLIEGYVKNDIKKFIKENDRSFFNPIAITLFDSVINNFLKKEVLIIQSDSIKSIKVVSESSAGKKVFNHCLKLYKSNKLDSIVNYESRKWKKMENIDSLVMKKMPNF